MAQGEQPITRPEGMSVVDFYAQQPHPSVFSPLTLLITVLLSVLGAIIGIRIIVSIGFTPNTSIIGALIAVMISYIPVNCLRRFKNINMQNIMETAISAGAFVAANGMLFTLALVWFFDKTLIVPMIIGGSIALILDILMMYFLFDSKIFPATGSWGPGVATSETIKLSAEGGKRSLTLLGSGVVGAIGQAFAIPMDVIGVCFLSHPTALWFFGIGLLLRAYSPQFLGIDLAAKYIPHGILVGAAAVAIIQVIIAISRKKKARTAAMVASMQNYSVPEQKTRIHLIGGTTLFMLASIFVAVISGLYADMSGTTLVMWVLYTAITCVVSEILIGVSAMNAGWFPAAPICMLFLTIGILLGFDVKALVLFAGFKNCVGPAFADMGYDLKTGWVLRGSGKNPEFNAIGKREQLKAELVGAVVGILVALAIYVEYCTNDLVPPTTRVFAATIRAGSNPEIVMALLIWSIPGAILQFIGGSERQIGIMLAVGLLILNPMGGIFVPVALIARFILSKKFHGKEENTMAIVASGFIAGSALYGFLSGVYSSMVKGK